MASELHEWTEPERATPVGARNARATRLVRAVSLTPCGTPAQRHSRYLSFLTSPSYRQVTETFASDVFAEGREGAELNHGEPNHADDYCI